MKHWNSSSQQRKGTGHTKMFLISLSLPARPVGFYLAIVPWVWDLPSSPATTAGGSWEALLTSIWHWFAHILSHNGGWWLSTNTTLILSPPSIIHLDGFHSISHSMSFHSISLHGQAAPGASRPWPTLCPALWAAATLTSSTASCLPALSLIALLLARSSSVCSPSQKHLPSSRPWSLSPATVHSRGVIIEVNGSSCKLILQSDQEPHCAWFTATVSYLFNDWDSQMLELDLLDALDIA